MSPGGNSPARIRVLIVDDHPVLRAGVAGILQGEPDIDVVAEGSDGFEAVALFRSHRPDVTLLDLQMPRLGGLEALRRIRSEFPDARALMLTIYAGDEDVFQSIQAGARGYLLKHATGTEIAQALRDAHAGIRNIGPTLRGRTLTAAEGAGLTPREGQILNLMAQGKENREIAEGLGIGIGTVKWHVATILSKLGVEDRTKAVVAALKRGLVRIE